MNKITAITNESLVVVPAYKSRKTIVKVVEEIIKYGFNNIIVSDDCSDIDISDLFINFPESVIFIKQEKNLGYGGNQKYLYDYAIKKNYKFVVMIHGDFQYTPSLILPILSMLKFAKYDFVFGSRILGGNTIKNGMPVAKYIANRLLTLFQNIFTGYKLSEYHSGLRGYRIQTLKSINYNKFSNSFLFDNQMILEIIKSQLAIGEVSCVTKYDTHSSSISYTQSLFYSIGIIKITFKHLFNRLY